MNFKIPPAIAVGIIAFIVGAAGGVSAMLYYYHGAILPADYEPDVLIKKLGLGAKKGGDAGPKQGDPADPPKKKSTAKRDLVTVITQMDTRLNPPKLNLDAENKKKVLEALAGLDALEELSDEDAEIRFQKLRDVVISNLPEFQRVGFNWPGDAAGAGPRPNPRNPFKDGKVGEVFKSVQKQLAQ
jgi:hypothetical protein